MIQKVSLLKSNLARINNLLEALYIQARKHGRPPPQPSTSSPRRCLNRLPVVDHPPWLRLCDPCSWPPSQTEQGSPPSWHLSCGPKSEGAGLCNSAVLKSGLLGSHACGGSGISRPHPRKEDVAYADDASSNSESRRKAAQWYAGGNISSVSVPSRS